MEYFLLSAIACIALLSVSYAVERRAKGKLNAEQQYTLETIDRKDRFIYTICMIGIFLLMLLLIPEDNSELMIPLSAFAILVHTAISFIFCEKLKKKRIPFFFLITLFVAFNIRFLGTGVLFVGQMYLRSNDFALLTF